MKPGDSHVVHHLVQEHRWIESRLDRLDALALGPFPGPSRWWYMIDLIEQFVDGFHHVKEEDLLFPILSRRGGNRLAAPLRCLESDHERARRRLKRMRELLRGASWRPIDVRALADTARAFSLSLRTHILKEDTLLMPEVEDLLDEETDRRLLRLFNRLSATTPFALRPR